MSKIESWVARPDVEQETNLEILDDKKVSVEVLRSPESGPNTGFADEKDDPVKLKTINVRIDLSTGGAYRFYCLTDDNDIKRGDIWRVTQHDGSTRRLVVKEFSHRQATVDVMLDYE